MMKENTTISLKSIILFEGTLKIVTKQSNNSKTRKVLSIPIL